MNETVKKDPKQSVSCSDSLRASFETFLKSDIRDMRVIEITDGEITLMSKGHKLITLYLNHTLNEIQGIPESFLKTGSQLWINNNRVQ